MIAGSLWDVLITYKLSEVGDFFRVELLHTAAIDLEKDLETSIYDLEKDLKNKFNLTDNQVRILNAVMKNKTITQNQLSELVGITSKNIRNNMKRLKEKGLIKRIGPDKGGYWQVMQGFRKSDDK